MTEGTNLQQSSSRMDTDFDDDEIFFGPITDKEKLVKERFEKRMQERGIFLPKLSNIIDESKNDYSEDSHYESFSTESKYDSFDDSLDGAKDLNPLEKNVTPKEINASNFLSEQVNVNCKRLHMDKKNIAGHFCDSLEDIHSLVSSGDKFSMSEEIEDINIMEISHTCEDSLRNDICIANKNSNSNEQYFDEDSLAILEYEKAFDDSLEDSNGPSISHIDSLILSKSKAHDVDSSVEKETPESKVTKSYFETSIEVIYENSKEAVANVKNLDPDRNSQPISECNLYRDSLEDLSELPNHNSSKASSVEKCDKPSTIHSSNDFSENEFQSKSSKQIADNHDFNSSLNKITSRKSSTGFMKPLSELITSDNFNETICIDDSVLPSDSILDSSSGGINTKSIKTNIKASQYVKESKLLLNPLDSNETICIDDSQSSSSYTTACSFPANDFASKATMSSDDLGSMEVDKAYVESAKPSIILKSNDTIWIEDSIIEPSDQAFSFSSNALNCPRNKYALKGNTFEFDTVTPPKPLNVVDVNETICIDDSIILPIDVRKEKISLYKSKGVKKNKRNSSLSKNFEKDFQKLRISDVDKQHHTDITSTDFGSPAMARNTMIDIVVRSPIHGCQRNSNVSEHFNLKEETENPKKVSTLMSGSPNERNLKVHIEVKSQGVNVISVSSVEQRSSEEHCASSMKDVKCMSGGSTNLTSELVNEFKGNQSNSDIVGDRLKSISADSQKKKKSQLKLTSVSKKLDLHIEKFSNKKKIEQNRYSDDFHVKCEKHDVSLLKALDLHDTSINISRSGPLQSRDSIIPLNLCLRDKFFERLPKPTPRKESKENIPSISFDKFATKERNIPQNEKSKGSPKKNKGTPLKNKIAKQQLNNKTEVTKSGGKMNSATKIPIRKIGNAPSSQRKLKLDSKPACNSDKPMKSPFVVPACPSATSHKEVSGENPKRPHHFCMVRNSMSKVPKSSQKNTSKKFQNIQSPIAKYIGNSPVQTPLKTTHRYDGNLFLASAEPPMATVKTPKTAGFPATPCSIKSDKKF